MLEEGLRLDPFDWPLKQALEAATQGVLRDLVEGARPRASILFLRTLHSACLLHQPRQNDVRPRPVRRVPWTAC